ncbi:MAG: S-adenosylmethionine decarboxylase, partial [Abditibacteriota bacterium]|nr:S-adenosylmethionine decarboxylase [Abditibacteriota bacterium]
MLADFYGVEAALLCDQSTLVACLLGAAQRCHLTPVDDARVHPFPGGGLTAFVMLSESHIAIHTYPEHGYLALDIFSCGAGDVQDALEVFRGALNPARVHT